MTRTRLPRNANRASPLAGRARNTSARRQRPVSRATFWTSMILSGLCFAVVVWMIVGNVSTASFGNWPFNEWPRILVVALLAIFITASLATTEIIPWTSRSWADWHQPKVLGTLIYLVLGAAGFAAGLVSVFDPPAAEQQALLDTKKDVGAVKRDTETIVKGQADIADAVGVGKASLIRQRIAGIWGRPDCAVTYRFALSDNALKVTSLKSPAGAQPYNPEYTVQVDRDSIASGGERISVIEANETVGFWPGFGVQFRYSTDGSSERLLWDHKKMATMPLELVRCERAQG